MTHPVFNQMLSKAGRIVNISSVSWSHWKAWKLGQANYSAAKSGHDRFYQGSGSEGARSNVCVMSQSRAIRQHRWWLPSVGRGRGYWRPDSLQRLAQPEEIAAAVMYLVGEYGTLYYGWNLIDQWRFIHAISPVLTEPVFFICFNTQLNFKH